ncbi:hypothetical protein K7X08_033914 [Anisodus acutangulus]|uniref:Uncharacterized protein n=1 Tax=Anisodus acutangulus TaxID=402998 RepID=A0A9Q1RP80_9SOLA|nr:hypothetical protein K7X08_033914 [Anisodus acutangulus]
MKIVEDAKTPSPASRSVGGVGWIGEEVDGENEEVEEEEEDEEDEYEKQVKQGACEFYYRVTRAMVC